MLQAGHGQTLNQLIGALINVYKLLQIVAYLDFNIE